MAKIDKATLSELKHAVEGGARMFKAFSNADALLASVESLQQTSNELEGAITEKRALLQSVKDGIASADADLAQTKAAAAAAKKQADSYASSTRSAADSYALSKQSEADALLAKATTDAADVDASIKAALDAAQVTLDAKTADLADIEARLIKAQAKAKAILGS